jgi:hypothetical protein
VLAGEFDAMAVAPAVAPQSRTPSVPFRVKVFAESRPLRRARSDSKEDRRFTHP